MINCLFCNKSLIEDNFQNFYNSYLNLHYLKCWHTIYNINSKTNYDYEITYAINNDSKIESIYYRFPYKKDNPFYCYKQNSATIFSTAFPIKFNLDGPPLELSELLPKISHLLDKYYKLVKIYL